MSGKKCQIHCWPEVANPVGVLEKAWQRRNRIKRAAKRRWNYLMNSLSSSPASDGGLTEVSESRACTSKLEKGDLVRVRSVEEIKSTLDKWNQYKRCAFMEEMWPFCGTHQRVLKRVEKFLDERDYLLKKCKGLVALEGVICNGTVDFGNCDRCCYFFWREEWLEKL